MSSIMSSSQGVVLATAMAAVSAGTVILLALGHQKLFSPTQFTLSTQIVPRSCISSDGKKKKKNKKKRVQFAEDVVEPSGNSEDFRKQHNTTSIVNNSSSSSSSSSSNFKRSISTNGDKNRGMPENRVALYNGILRDRVVHRVAYSY